MKDIEVYSKTFGNFTINKVFEDGGSPVKKYLLTKDNEYYLLRLFDPRFITSRKIAYYNMQLLHTNRINIQEPIEFGLCNNNKNVYMIVKWIDGKSIEEILPTKNDEDKVNLGIISGQELQKLHSVNRYKNINLVNIYKEKLNRKKQKLKELGIFNRDIDEMFIYLESNLDLLENCITSVIHGDIHPGNIMINNLGKLIFIDLDVCDYGPSWNDLSSNACLLNNDEYYMGLLDGYFNNSIPYEFWRAYNFYGSLHCINYIHYSIRTPNLGLSHGLNAVRNFITTTSNLSEKEPNWYIETKRKVLRREKI